MDSGLLWHWFQTCFVVIKAREQLEAINVEPRGVLLLDNCSAHPPDLVSDDGNFVVKFLP